MNIKFYQVTDNVHGTIFYTKLEREIINTPFFNRLHDVNQSSTVYWTFPPNRTKRYEHSLGTMQLTSDVFYNASINSAGSEEFDVVMHNADAEFNKLIHFIQKGKRNFIFSFGQNTLATLDHIKQMPIDKIKDAIRDCKNVILSDNNRNTANGKLSEQFTDNWLLNMVPHSLKDEYHVFLYLCLLQALRLSGLLHDIGHPPQSHIIENVLIDIYDDLKKNAEEERTPRQNKFIEILSSYQNIEDESIRQIDESMAIQTENKKIEHLHEMIGVRVIKNIIEWVFPELMEKQVSKGNSNKDIVNVLYYMTVAEFLFAIIRNKNAFWYGLHNIVDGTIDTDRLDFVQRDSGNSGMVWGKIPYKRLINTVKFGLYPDPVQKDKKNICVCFSDKNIELMDELLNNRYKIFTMINYHHRSAKIASLYKKAVFSLCMQYLKSPEPDTSKDYYFSDISGLWRTVEIVYAKKSSALNFIQWNDSWLNGLLHKRLIERYDLPLDDSENSDCDKYLRELILNEHKHFSVVKRETELLEINEAVSDTLEELMDKISNEILQLQQELIDYEDFTSEQQMDTEYIDNQKEAFSFLCDIYDAFSSLNWSAIEMLLGNDLIPDTIKNVLRAQNEFPPNYMIEKVKFSLGVGDVFVYDYEGTIHRYDKYSNVREYLETERLHFPYYYIYIKSQPNHPISTDFLSKLRKEIGYAIGQELIRAVENQIHFETPRNA